MSKLLHKWIKPGVGPVLKIMADASYNPETTPNTDYHKFRFNSETGALGYTWEQTPPYEITANVLWIGGETGADRTTYGYYPAGSSASNCHGIVAVQGYSTPIRRRIVGNLLALERNGYQPFGYRTILRRMIDRSDWTYAWPTTVARYYVNGNSASDYCYVVTDANRVDLTTRDAISGNLGTVNIGLTTRRFNPLDSLFPSWSAAWFEPGPTPTVFNPIGVNSSSDAPVVGEDRFVVTEFPLENDPYPEVAPTFAPGVPCLHLSPNVARMSQPGWDVDMALRKHLIFSHDKFPMKCARTGSFTIQPDEQINVDVAYPITPFSWLETHVAARGSGMWTLPPWDNNERRPSWLRHRIVGQQIQFHNQATAALDCRFFLLAGYDKTTSVGTAPVLDEADDLVRILRPGTAGTRDGDVIIDSRCATLPVVANGWISGSQLTATASDVGRWGTNMHTVSFDNSGWKPMVLAVARYVRGGRYIYQSPVIKYPDVGNEMSASTFIVRVRDTSATFYFTRAGAGRMEDSFRWSPSYVLIGEQMQLDGIRYYVFAVPPSL